MPWYVDFFDESYFKKYYHLDWERTGRDVDLITRLLDLKREHKVLDIPCGFGRHSIVLKLRGHDATGMEYNPPQIDRAKTLMKEKEAEFEIIRADMREIPGENVYDRAFNFFTSFGYFTDEENRRTMHQFFKVLKPGGIFLMEMANRDGILKRFRPHGINHLEDGSIFLEERRFDALSDRMFNTHTIIGPDGSIDSISFNHRMYCPRELIELFEEAGFDDVKVYGDGGKEFECFSSRICVTGIKRD